MFNNHKTNHIIESVYHKSRRAERNFTANLNIPQPSRLWVAILVSFLMISLVGFVSTPSALAHASIVSISPASGASLTSPPASVSVSFNEPVSTNSKKVQLLDSTGKVVPTSYTVSRKKDSYTLKPTKRLPRGAYTLRFSAVSADGHTVAAASSFAVGALPSGKAFSASFTSAALKQSIRLSSDKVGVVSISAPPSATSLELRHKKIGAAIIVPLVKGSGSTVVPMSGSWSATLVLRPNKFTEQRLLAKLRFN